jgi:hypothetical protein
MLDPDQHLSEKLVPVPHLSDADPAFEKHKIFT